MSRIVLVRHGETDWNREQIFRGRADVPLNATGLKQARATGEALKRHRIEAIYSSPLSRAMETAKTIAAFHPEITVRGTEGFTDIDFGRWEGMFHKKVEKEYRDIYGRWRREPHTVKMPGGESLDDVKLRAMQELNRIITAHENQTIVIAAHRVVNKVVLCAVLGLTNSHFWSIRQDTCAINIFHNSERGFIISVINDTCHMASLSDAESMADF